MSKVSSKSVEKKLEVVQLYLNDGKSIGYLARKHEACETIVRDWIRKYKQDGIDGLIESRTWKKYKISDKSVFKRWIIRYIVF